MASLSGTNLQYGDYRTSLNNYRNDRWGSSGLANALYGGPQAEVSGSATDASRASDNAQEQWSIQNFQDWMGTMSPEQQAEYKQLQHASYLKDRGKMRLAMAASTAAIGGLGAMYGGAGALGGEAAAGGLEALAGGGAESFPVAAGGPVEFSSIPELMGGAAGGGAVASPVYGGSLPEFSNLSLETGLPAGGSASGAEFGSPEQRASDYAGGYGGTDNVTPATVNSGGNPILDGIKQALGINAQSPLGQVSQAGKIGSNLMDIYQTYQNKKRNQGFVNNLNSLYGPDSPYAFQLNKALSRSYAASGRRSDVGGRNVELQARLAEMNGRLAPTLNTANNQQGMYSNRMLGSLWDLGNRTGAFDKAANGLSTLFGG